MAKWSEKVTRRQTPPKQPNTYVLIFAVTPAPRFAVSASRPTLPRSDQTLDTLPDGWYRGAVRSEIAIIVPVFNEAQNVIPLTEQVTAALRDQSRSYELVFVDDGSTDDTWSNIREARRRDRRVRGLKHPRNFGQSAALWTGLQAVTSDIIVTLDGDLQNDPADIPKLLAALDEYDFACGVRAKRRDNFIRRFSSEVARRARKLVLGVDFTDTGCAMRAFKRSAIAGVFPFNGMHRFLPILVHGNGAKTCQIPINHRPRIAGVSKYGIWNRLGRGIFDLFAVAWYQKRRVNQIQAVELD